MYALAQSLRAAGNSGQPLPTVYPSLARKGASFVRGQLVLIVSPPGTGKSAFALSVALRSGATALYYSADSDGSTQLARAYAMATGCSMTAAITVIRERHDDSIRHALGDVPVRMDYEPAPTPEGIGRTLEAYYELHGEYPELIVLDNVLDVVMEPSDEGSAATTDSLMGQLHEVARRTSACLVCLHHVTGAYNDGDKPIPLSGVKGQISRVPEMVLTLSEGVGALRVAVVKNRNGAHDKTGNDFIELDFDRERMRFTDPGGDSGS